jgi:uncharacterized protein (DUF2062 family)
MLKRFKRHLPSPESIRRNRWLCWLGPALMDARLWHFSRRGLATGVAMGVFFGFLVPIGQIPLAAGATMMLRGNIPGAVASTFVTNPVTFGPVMFAAWHLGNLALGEPAPAHAMPHIEFHFDRPAKSRESWFTSVTNGIRSAGKPIIVGLGLLAVLCGLLSYLLVSWTWRLSVWLKRRRRGPQRAALGATRP